MRRLQAIGLAAFFALLLVWISSRSTIVRAAPVPKSPKPGQTVSVKLSGERTMIFCWIPAGTTQLGASSKEIETITEERDKPKWLLEEAMEKRGNFETKEFWLGKYEVTQAQWNELDVEDKNPSYFSKTGMGKDQIGDLETSDFPVERVSWIDAHEYIKLLNEIRRLPNEFGGAGSFRLPTGNEWEYACRAGTEKHQVYYFGDSISCKLANIREGRAFEADAKQESVKRTQPVGSYEKVAPHPWGLCDMYGNVMEWTLDEIKEDDVEYAYHRGGGWNSIGTTCRSAWRGIKNPKTSGGGDNGFRVLYQAK